MIHSIVFILITTAILRFSWKRYAQVYQAIKLGKPNWPEGSALVRFKNMLLFALGQRKMFTKPVSGIFHFFIYTAFLLTQVEFLEIFTDGLFGKHRLFANKIGFLYPLAINTIEILSLLALIATAVFLIRRNILKISRFHKPELKGWPFADANIILLGEIILVISIFMMNGADQYLQQLKPESYHPTGSFFLSASTTMPLISGLSADWIIFTERFFWWTHYLVVLGFIAYLPYSKHLHIFLAFPSSYYADLNPRGEIQNIPYIQNEVKGMLGLENDPSMEAPNNFGAQDVNELSQQILLQAFSCTECGRCTAVCPANMTGKKLSPRKIVMDIRDRAEEVVQTKAFKKSENGTTIEITDGLSLFDKISKEELYACTTCNACVEACPVLINPLKPILELRRYDILMNSGGPSEWLPMFNSLENNQAVWAMSENRTNWIKIE